VAVVHQILPNLEYGDAISNYAILLRRVLRSMGHRSRLYVCHIHPKFYFQAWPFKAIQRLAKNEDITWIYHYSIGSEITQIARNLLGRIVLLFHNITPPLLTVQAQSHLTSYSHAGLEDLKTIIALPRVAIGSSEYNRAQLAKIGFRNTDVLPVVLDYARFDRPAKRSIVSAYRDGGVNFLTVGRIVPHKKIEDVIRIFHYYHECINPHSRLFVVGDPKGMEAYQARLIQLCRALNLSNVHFTGKVRFRELLSYYRIADVYLCMSEHEGFCVPLLECMYLGVPIIANLCTGIGETMGDAGILVRQKRFDEIAEMAHLLISDKDLRARVIQKQKERTRFYSEEHLVRQLNAILVKAQRNS
jgi:glycosyltransferase involved in cell wall biosynthesis